MSIKRNLIAAYSRHTFSISRIWVQVFPNFQSWTRLRIWRFAEATAHPCQVFPGFTYERYGLREVKGNFDLKPEVNFFNNPSELRTLLFAKLTLLLPPYITNKFRVCRPIHFKRRYINPLISLSNHHYDIKAAQRFNKRERYFWTVFMIYEVSSKYTYLPVITIAGSERTEIRGQ